MPRARIPIGSVSQICIEPQTKGLCAVFLVETNTADEAENVAKFFDDLESTVAGMQLSSGKLVSYAVQLQGDDQSLLEEIYSFLKSNFDFVLLHRSFDSLIYEIIKDLCKDTGSTLIPISKCDICGKADPFPETIVVFLDNQGSHISRRNYCATCTAESAGRNNKEFMMALLEADRSDLGIFRDMNLVRSRSSKKRVAFKIKSDAEQQAAIS